MAAARARSAILGTVFALVACLAAVAAGVYAAAVHHYSAAVVLPVAYLAAVLVSALSPVGRTLPGRMALGVVLLAAPLAFAASLVGFDGVDPLGLVVGGLLLLCALPLLLRHEVAPGPRPLTAYAPFAIACGAALLLVAAVAADDPSLATLTGGGAYLVLAALAAAVSGAAGPARFALGVLLAVIAAAGVYLLAISGDGGWPQILVGALVTAACVASIGSLDKVRPAQSPDGGEGVR
ncbi:hypothetical protein ACFPM7_03485 [Actinokineospora guangxiensis]|uniref:Uncharacterized protein n=1 Tax=Actinokineospora guangxiensis TaxID=1490288 RepID=A0ABW0EJL7_9PSEU